MDHLIEDSSEAAWKFMAYRLTKSHKIFGDVLQYWDSLRDGELPPARADLDPRIIQKALSNSFILDRARPGTIRLRVAGGHLNTLMGMEVRGMPIRALFDLMERRRLMELMETVFTGPALLELDLVSEGQSAPPLSGKMLILPLRDHAGNLTKALGCLVTDGIVGEAPRRFRIRREVLTPVASSEKTGARARPLPGFAEASEPFRTASVRNAVPEASREGTNISSELEAASEPGPVPYLRIVR